MKKSLSAFPLLMALLLSLTCCSAPQWEAVSSTAIRYGDQPAASLEDSSPSPDASGPEENRPDASQSGADASGNPGGGKSQDGTLDENGWYSSKEEVALYIHLYDRLPGNYVSKQEAEEAGWHGGNVERYTGEGTAIGGSYFGNREGLLPKAEGRSYTECDIDTVGESSRGAKRIVFSNDGLIYYTEDHYESFELLYGEP